MSRLRWIAPLLAGIFLVVVLALVSGPVRQIALLSILVSGGATLLATVIGVPVGLLIGLNRFPGRRPLKLIIYTLFGLPPVLVGLLMFLALAEFRSSPTTARTRKSSTRSR